MGWHTNELLQDHSNKGLKWVTKNSDELSVTVGCVVVTETE